MANNKIKTPEARHHLKILHRFNQHAISRKEYLRLDMNEGVSGLPDNFIKEALAEINSETLATYPEYSKLQQKIAMHNTIKPENICLSSGSDAAIKYIFDAYISPGDKVLLTNPSFAMYTVYCKMFQATPVVVEYNPDLSIPIEEYLDRLNTDIKIAVLVNPNNPTGTVLEFHDIMRLIKRAADSHTLMIVDEAYFYFYPESVIKQIENYENLIVLRTFSKLCSMASLRVGYAASCPDIIENLAKVKPTYDVNGIAVLFAEKILDKPNIIEQLINDVYEGQEYLLQKLSEENIEYKKSCANFVLIKCNNRPEEILRKLEEKKILLSGGFKQEYLRDFIRVTIGEKTIMEQFWKVFIDIWKSS